MSLLETVADSRRFDRYTDKLPTDFLFYDDVDPALTTVSALINNKAQYYIDFLTYLISYTVVQSSVCLKPSWKSWYPLAAQTIFSLLDFLTAWHRSRSADYAVVVAALAKSSDRRSDSAFKATEDQKSRLLQLHMGQLVKLVLIALFLDFIRKYCI